jgi:Methyltransferase domain
MHRASSTEAVAEFPDEYFDWIYIDGNHQNELVKKDLESFSRKVKTDGYITGDDYGEGEWWKGGVKKAVDEFVSSGLGSMILVQNRQSILQKCPCSGVDARSPLMKVRG